MSLFRKKKQKNEQPQDELITAIDKALNMLAFGKHEITLSHITLEVGTANDAVYVLCPHVIEESLLNELKTYYEPLGCRLTSGRRTTTKRDLKTSSITIKPKS